VDPAELEKQVGELEVAVDRLRALYDQYFMGIEKLEPSVPHKEVERRIYVLRKEQIRNTAQRFRFQMVLQRYNTLQTHWQRVCREIERGTFKRHVVRAEQRFARRSNPPPPESDVLFDIELPSDAAVGRLAASLEVLDSDLAAEFAPAPVRPLSPSAASPARAIHPARPTVSAPPIPPAVVRAPLQATPTVRPVVAVPPPTSGVGLSQRPAKKPSAPSIAPRARTDSSSSRTDALADARSAQVPASPSRRPGGPPDLTEQRLREIYAQLVESRRKQRESTAHITFDSVARTVRESGAKLRQQFGRTVDFEVVVKDGRTVLRPVVK
jgi:hypothetical protein